MLFSSFLSNRRRPVAGCSSRAFGRSGSESVQFWGWNPRNYRARARIGRPHPHQECNAGHDRESGSAAATPHAQSHNGEFSRRKGTPSGSVNRYCGSRTYKPNSVCWEAAPWWAEARHRRPRTAGRPFLWAAHYCAALATYPKVLRTEQARVPPSQRALQRRAMSIERAARIRRLLNGQYSKLAAQ